jgi:hypothetical protein
LENWGKEEVQKSRGSDPLLCVEICGFLGLKPFNHKGPYPDSQSKPDPLPLGTFMVVPLGTLDEE